MGSATSGWRARAARAPAVLAKLHAKSPAQKVLGLCRRCQRLWRKQGGDLPADRSRQGGVARGRLVWERPMGFCLEAWGLRGGALGAKVRSEWPCTSRKDSASPMAHPPRPCGGSHFLFDSRISTSVG